MRAGPHVLGVRTSSTELAELLRARFADRVVPEADPPGNLSVLLAARAECAPQELHRLYVTYTRVVRSRSASRVLHALWHELDLRDVEVARERMQVLATVLVRDGAAHLLPATLRRSIVDDERRWQRDGFRLVDRRGVDLDPVAGTITVPESGLGDVDDDLAALDVDDRRGNDPVAGTFPIVTWALPYGERSLAGRVVEAAGQVPERTAHDGVALVGALAVLLADLPDTTVGSLEDLRSQLAG